MAGLIYSANIGGYDTPKAVHVVEPGVDYFMFTDGKAPPGWTAKVPPKGEARKVARCVKVMTPCEFDYDWYLWLDATMQIKKPIMPLIEKLMASEHDIAVLKHNEWDCAYSEITACIERRKDDPYRLIAALELLKKSKFPHHFGQAATGVLFRKKSKGVMAHAVTWWLDMQATTLRDQATFMLNVWEQGRYVEWIPGLHTKNDWFEYRRGHLK